MVKWALPWAVKPAALSPPLDDAMDAGSAKQEPSVLQEDGDSGQLAAAAAAAAAEPGGAPVAAAAPRPWQPFKALFKKSAEQAAQPGEMELQEVCHRPPRESQIAAIY